MVHMQQCGQHGWRVVVCSVCDCSEERSNHCSGGTVDFAAEWCNTLLWLHKAAVACDSRPRAGHETLFKYNMKWYACAAMQVGCKLRRW
jgi:hypothetical protein